MSNITTKSLIFTILVVSQLLLHQNSFISALSSQATQIRRPSPRLSAPKIKITTPLSKRPHGSRYKNQIAKDFFLAQMETCEDCRQLGDIVRSHPELVSSSHDAFEVLGERISHLKPNMNNRDISGIMITLSKLSVPYPARQIHQKLMSTLAEVALDRIDEFTARDISMILNALAKAKIPHQKIFQRAGEAAVPIIHTFNPQDIAQMVNACAKMNFRNDELFDEIAKAAIPILHKFNAHGLDNIVNAYAKVNYRHPELFDEVAKAAIRIMDTSFGPKRLVTTLNAYAMMEHRHPILFDQVASVLVQSCDKLNSKDLKIMSKAFAKFDHYPTELLEAANA